MAKQQPQSKTKQATVSAQKATSPSATMTPFIFDKTNYIIMIAGVVVVLIGFALMSGGATNDRNVFPQEEIYSFRRITLAPIVIMIGFGIEIFAILKRPKE